MVVGILAVVVRGLRADRWSLFSVVSFVSLSLSVCCAGIFATPMLAALPEKAKTSLSSQVPFPKRLGHPEEFADCAFSLVTNQYYNGTTVRLDGSIRMAAL